MGISVPEIGKSTQRQAARHPWLKAVCLTLVLILLGLAAWSFLIEPDRLVVKYSNIQLEGWRENAGPLRIALIADLHAGAPFIKEDKLRQVVAAINETHPDIVLMAGDFIIQDVIGGRPMEPEQIASALQGLHPPLGTYAVLGNHDWWGDGERVGRVLGTAGIRVLENEAVPIEHSGRRFWLVGIADLWTRTPRVESALANVTDNAPIIVLTHNPDLFPSIPDRVILTLAGHTHGGQVNLPFIGRRVVPSEYGQRYAIGHMVENGRHLFVTPGIGTSIIPIRFRVPPEISVIDL
jgi:predicted MPP superfamily phosphohydrolase